MNRLKVMKTQIVKFVKTLLTVYGSIVLSKGKSYVEILFNDCDNIDDCHHYDKPFYLKHAQAKLLIDDQHHDDNKADDEGIIVTSSTKISSCLDDTITLIYQSNNHNGKEDSFLRKDDILVYFGGTTNDDNKNNCNKHFLTRKIVSQISFSETTTDNTKNSNFVTTTTAVTYKTEFAQMKDVFSNEIIDHNSFIAETRPETNLFKLTTHYEESNNNNNNINNENENISTATTTISNVNHDDNISVRDSIKNDNRYNQHKKYNEKQIMTSIEQEQKQEQKHRRLATSTPTSSPRTLPPTAFQTIRTDPSCDDDDLFTLMNIGVFLMTYPVTGPLLAGVSSMFSGWSDDQDKTLRQLFWFAFVSIILIPCFPCVFSIGLVFLLLGSQLQPGCSFFF